MCDFSWTSLTDEFRVARTEHKCYECQRPIEKGEKHHYYAGLVDGEFWVHKAHESCFEFLKRFSAEGDGCWMAGEMESGMYEADAYPGLQPV